MTDPFMSAARVRKLEDTMITSRPGGPPQLNLLYVITLLVAICLAGCSTDRQPNAAQGNGKTPVQERGAVVVVYDSSIPAICFAASDVKTALRTAGYTPSDVPLANLADATAPVRIVITTADAPVAKAFLAAAATSAPVAQGFAIRKETTPTHTNYWVLGGDSVGAMYGGLEVAETTQLARSLDAVKPLDKHPFIAQRGIKFNIPLDARTPSYSDAADNAWNNVEAVWDFEYWKHYLDQLARDRYNVVTLWNEHPFPSMVKVPEYPKIALSDIKKNTVDFDCAMDGSDMLPDQVVKNLVTIKTMSIEEKIEFWRKVMRYGHDRGIDFYIVTWNVFTYGTFGQYGITDSMSNETTKDYLRKSVRELVLTYPLLAGIGITAGEHMQDDPSLPGWQKSSDPQSRKKLRSLDAQKEDWLWQTYGLGLKDAKEIDPKREVRLIHRTWQSGIPLIAKAFAGYPDTFDYEYKYSIAHMFSSTKPNFADSTIAELPAGKKIWLTIRNDDFFMTRWGDAEYAREYIRNMPPGDKFAGFMMGSSGYIWGREWMSTEPETPRQQTLDKHWYYFMLFGRLAYDPGIPAETFRGMMAQKFQTEKVADLYDGWASVSRIIPLVNQFHWQGADFQWYPEACLSAKGHPESVGYHTVRHFIKMTPQPGVAMTSIPAYVAAVSAGTPMKGATPPEVAKALRSYADEGLQRIEGIDPGDDKELRLTLGDIRAVAYLGYYYSEKILGATDLALFEKTGNVSQKDSAIGHLQAAADYWRSYAAQISSQYTPWKSARIGMINVKALWKDALNDVALAGGDAAPLSSQAPEGSMILEAEAATVGGGTVASTLNGYSGRGYAAITDEKGGTLTWKFTAPESGRYSLAIRYAMETGDIPATLAINGAIVDRSLSLWATGGKSTWQMENRSVVLKQGTNTITLATTNRVPAIDLLSINRTESPVLTHPGQR